MSSHPTLLMAAATGPALGPQREVLMALHVSPSFLSRARELQGLCWTHVLNDVESFLLGLDGYLDLAVGSPLAGVRDPIWTWVATSHFHYWRVHGYVNEDPDANLVLVATSPLIEMKTIRRLARTRCSFQFVNGLGESLWGFVDRREEAWPRFIQLKRTLPEPFGVLGPS